MAVKTKSTLITWIAKQNDPLNRNGSPGPNLTLLFDPASPYAGTFDEVVILYRQGEDGDSEEHRKVQELVREVHGRSPGLRVVQRPWKGVDPTDHAEIYEFLRTEIPKIRRERIGKPFVVHVSPGTPSMQTVWVLMVETGEIESPVELVKTYKEEDRKNGKPAAAKVVVGLDTYFKVYQRNQFLAKPEHETVEWDPRRFKSERLKAVYAEARRFAQVKVPLLILGERGTGKTTLAAWVRSFGPYRKPENDRNPPVVPCGQYVEETMRAELFGYVKGAFTDAKETKTGLLAAADGDTLFLDEIGDITPGLQRLLIKALEEHVYSPLGSAKAMKSDFRLITATNRRLEELRRRLDPDFLDRIGMLRVEMPPLREMPEDLDWIWDSVLAKAEVRAGVSMPEKIRGAVRPEVVAYVRRHPLPGNLRDLFVVAYRLIAAAGDVHEPMNREQALAYALERLNVESNPGKDSGTGRILRAYLENAPLDGVLRAGPISTKQVVQDLQRYMAREIRRTAKVSGVDPSSLCDVKERTLRSWVE